MKLRRLSETQKHFPLWLDKNYDSNFSKHLRVVNEQNLDIYNSLKKLEYARLLEKPIQIIKKQSNKESYSLTFKVNIDSIKKVTIYENPQHEDVDCYDGDYQYNFKITSEPHSISKEYSTDDVNYYEDTIKDIIVTSSNKYLIKVETFDNYTFWKGYPENDTSDYYCNIDYNNIKNRRVLSFTALAKNINTVKAICKKTVTCIDESSEYYGTVLEDSSTNLIYYEYVDYDEKGNEIPILGKNRFKQNYRLDDNEAINTQIYYEIVNDDSNTNNNNSNETNDSTYVKASVVYTYELNVTLHNSNQILKSYYPQANSDYNSLFDHDYSLDMIGNMLNVPRHKYNEVSDKELPYTYPPYNSKLTEDDYYYQERIKHYINHYNREYFPVLELKKNYAIDSVLESRYKLISQQDESYQATDYEIDNTKEYNLIPIITNCYIYCFEDGSYKVYEVSNYDTPVEYSSDNIIYYITEVVCYDNEEKGEELEKQYLGKYCQLNSSNELINQSYHYSKVFNDESYKTIFDNIIVNGDDNYRLSYKTYRDNQFCDVKYNDNRELKYYYKEPIDVTVDFYDSKDYKLEDYSINETIDYRNDLIFNNYIDSGANSKAKNNSAYVSSDLSSVTRTVGTEYTTLSTSLSGYRALRSSYSITGDFTIEFDMKSVSGVNKGFRLMQPPNASSGITYISYNGDASTDWSHIKIVRTGSTITCYIDGDVTSPSSTPTLSDYSAQVQLAFGLYQSGTTDLLELGVKNIIIHDSNGVWCDSGVSGDNSSKPNTDYVIKNNGNRNVLADYTELSTYSTFARFKPNYLLKGDFEIAFDMKYLQNVSPSFGLRTTDDSEYIYSEAVSSEITDWKTLKIVRKGSSIKFYRNDDELTISDQSNLSDNTSDVYFYISLYQTTATNLLKTAIKNVKISSINYDDSYDIDFAVPKEASKLDVTFDYGDTNVTVYDLSLNRLVEKDLSQYMRTKEDYNSCVYDLMFDYEDIPTNLRLPDGDEFDIIVKKCFPVTKKAFTTIKKKYNDNVLGVVDKPYIAISNVIPYYYRNYTGIGGVTISDLTLNAYETYNLSFTSTSSKKLYIKISCDDVNMLPKMTSKLTLDGDESENIGTKYIYEFTVLNVVSSMWKLEIIQEYEEGEQYEEFNYSDLKLYDKAQKNRIEF